MKNTIVMLVLLVFGLVPLFGQDIHSPAEILEIMEKSPVSYELYPLEQAITPLARICDPCLALQKQKIGSRSNCVAV